MRTLYLHIGHGKTGTSYVQSCFARSRDALTRHQIDYPADSHDQQAVEGRVTSGNGSPLARALTEPAKRRGIATPLRKLGGNVLFSSEFLFHHMALLKTPDEVLDFADHAGLERVEILMLIRDPLDHMRSAYLQNVQRTGLSEPIDGMARRFNIPVRAHALMRSFTHPRITLTVRNYSRMKDRLTEETERWLGLPHATLSRPAQSRVNRSLTAAEMEMQRLFNQRFGASGEIFADMIVDQFPDLKTDYPVMSRAARQQAHDRCARAMQLMNLNLPPDQAYQFDLDPAVGPDEVEAPDVAMTEAQIDAIVGALAPRIRPFSPSVHAEGVTERLRRAVAWVSYRLFAGSKAG